MAFQLYTDINWDDLVYIYDRDVTNAYADFYDGDHYFTEDSVFIEDIKHLSSTTNLSDIEALEELFKVACDSSESGTDPIDSAA